VAAPDQSLGFVTDATLPAPIPDMPLIDQAGRRTTLAALRGHVVVLADFLTLCEDICPFTSANLVQAAASLQRSDPASAVDFVEITLDPLRDTPERIHKYAALFPGAPSNWRVFTGAPKDLDELWRALGVYHERTYDTREAGTDWLTHRRLAYDVAHTDAILFLDQHLHERFVISAGPRTSRSGVPDLLYGTLDALGRKDLTKPPADAWSSADALQILSWLLNNPRIASPGP